jgi:tRNA(Ser,Leu) C12 N-acetylase TAN1
MCTIPHCELIETTISTAKDKHYNNAENKASEDTKTASTGQDGSISGNDDGNGDVSKNDSECNSGGKRKQDEGVGLNDNTESNPKKQKIDDANGETKWDPISTVQSIFADIREQNTEAPRSRFVNRMVPMQATCFASMEEIEANVRELLKTFLLPKGVEYGKRIEEGTANDDGTASLPSFKIEFKRRNCNHIRREQVVECVAGIIQKLTDDHWNNLSNDGASSTETKQEAKKPLFRVDLTDPKYTIIIEICRTLCGMSVVSNATSFKKFNLLMAQGEVDALNGDEAKQV